MRRIAGALAVAGCLWALPAARAQEGWSMRHYDSQNGLPQNSVRAMEMTDEGYLWITTEAGLVRFDGNQMLVHSRFREPIVTSDRFVSLVRCAEGGLYTTTEASTRYWIQGNRFTLLGGSRWGGMRLGGTVPSAEFFRRIFDAEHPLAGRTEWPYYSTALLVDRACVVPTGPMLLVYQDTSLVRRVPTKGLAHEPSFFVLDKRLDAVDGRGGFWRVDLDRGTLRPLSVQGLPVSLADLPREQWALFGTQEDILLRIDRQVYRVVPTADGENAEAHLLLDGLLSGQFINCMRWVPEEEALLVGTTSAGLYLYTRMRMQHISTGTGMGPFGVYPQVLLGGDRVLTGFDHSVEVGRSGILPPTLPMFRFERTLLRDVRGRIWHTHGDTLFRYAPATGKGDTLIAPEVGAFGGFLEEGDSVWVGSDRGIGYRTESGLHWTYRYPKGEVHTVPIMLQRGPDGRLWVATCEGVLRLDSSGRQAEAVPELRGKCVRALRSIDGRMLIGTYGNGAYIWEDGRCMQLPLDQRDLLTHVHAFMPDSLGAIWISANQGLFRTMRKGLDLYTRDTTYNIFFAHFGEQAGLGGVELNGGCDPAYVRLPDGTASFPALDGLVRFRPEGVPDPYPGRPILLDAVALDGRAITDTSAIELPPDYQELEVRISLAYWGELANAQIEYQLPGRQDSWEPLAIGERMVRFRRLPSGDYVLSLRKVGALGNGDRHMVHLRFKVLPPYYRTPWFYGLCAVVLLSLGYLALRMNAARLRHTNLVLEANVRARTQELERANEGLRRSLDTKEMLVSIISHDIVTPLRFISRVASGAVRSAAKGDTGPISSSLRDISMSSAKLYANAQNVLNWIKHQDRRIELRPLNIAVNPLVEEVLAMVHEHAASRSIHLHNDVPLDDIVRTDRDVLSIILQNLVNNAVNHTDHSEVRVTAAGSATDYRITVSDTGPGMSPKALAHIRRLTGGERRADEGGEDNIHGLGYVIITELLQVLGGTLGIDSAESQGTRVTLTFPRRSVKERS